ncbi:hypothetical protein POM88_019162 [Heracleum sosnowskyi]|uniref:non-specific serine/threonine protein kinase n=1 Tax=Heracleum sosnowskyi TaxID=360622 RepID=A0AAD8IRU0_9APIA|nr:hypothetical protein POM88_019162 [Heracleum sosnowskyi]
MRQGYFNMQPIHCQDGALDQFMAPVTSCGVCDKRLIACTRGDPDNLRFLYSTAPGGGFEVLNPQVLGQPLKFPDSPSVSFAARDLIRGLLVKEPQHRLAYRRGATEIKQHPFFQSAFGHYLSRCINNPEAVKPKPRAGNLKKKHDNTENKESNSNVNANKGTELHTDTSEGNTEDAGHDKGDSNCVPVEGNVTEQVIAENVIAECNDDFVQNMALVPYIIGDFLGCDVVMDEDQILGELNRELNNDDGLEDFDCVPVGSPTSNTRENAMQVESSMGNNQVDHQVADRPVHNKRKPPRYDTC